MLVKISMSTFMLENMTTFFLFKIHHPIPLELKLYYVEDIIMNHIQINPRLLTFSLFGICLDVKSYEGFSE